MVHLPLLEAAGKLLRIQVAQARGPEGPRREGLTSERAHFALNAFAGARHGAGKGLAKPGHVLRAFLMFSQPQSCCPA